MWRNTRGNTGQRGVVQLRRKSHLILKTQVEMAIEGVKLYLEDTPSTYAKNAVFLKANNDTTNGSPLRVIQPN